MKNFDQKNAAEIFHLLKEINDSLQSCEELTIKAEGYRLCSENGFRKMTASIDQEKKKIEDLEEQLLTVLEEKMQTS